MKRSAVMLSGTRRFTPAAVAALRTLVLGLIVLHGCGSPEARLAPLAQDAVVLAFGDSLTHGTGAALEQDYPTLLEHMISRRVVNAGVPGETAAGGRTRIVHELKRHRPSLVILCQGGNDMLRGRPEEVIASDLRAMIQACLDHAAGVVLVGVPRPTLRSTVPPFYAELAEEFNIPYQGEVLRDVLRQRGLKSDLIHPNSKGYLAMAQALRDLLSARGALPGAQP